jgi:hypothetical protein
MAGCGVGALMEALGILLDLLDGFAVGRQAGVGLVEKEKVIVPFAEGFLGGLEACGEAGGAFGDVDAGFGQVACSFGGFAEGVEVLVVLGVEAADVFGEPGLGDGDEFCAAEVEVDDGSKEGFEVVEAEFDLLLLLLEAFGEFAFGFVSHGGKVVAKTFGVRGAVVGAEEIGVHVGVAHCACCAAHFAKGTLERFGFLLYAGDPAGEGEELEGGFDAAGGGTETMDPFGSGLFEAVCDRRFELQGLTEKDSDGLRHDFTFGWRSGRGRNDDTTPVEKLCATGVVNGGSVRCT